MKKNATEQGDAVAGYSWPITKGFDQPMLEAP